MIAPSGQLLPLELAGRTRPGHAPRVRPRIGIAPRHVALLVGALGFFCFLPYSSISVGNRSALQFGNLLTLLLALPALFVSWRHRPFWVYPLLMGPLCLATVKVALTGEGDPSLALKNTLDIGLACLTILVVQLWAPKYGVELLTGIAVVTIAHTAVGLLQLYSFSHHGAFPLLWLYQNPSFLDIQEYHETIARWIQRPFGLFPEPSAMSSSLAPFVLFFAAQFLGLVRLRREPAKWQRVLFAVAAAGGLALIILSQSGHAAVTLAALVLFTAVWFVRSRATVRTYLTVVAAFGVVLPLVLWAAAASLSNRVGGAEMGNSSWTERSSSLVYGFWLVVEGDLSTLVFGMGPGMTSPALQYLYKLEAVWSVSLTYVYETGLIGLAVVCWIGQHLLRNWKWSGWGLPFAAFTGVWLVGITVTTSYSQLLPLWVALGWLSVWPDICRSNGPDAPPARPQSRRDDPSIRPRRRQSMPVLPTDSHVPEPAARPTGPGHVGGPGTPADGAGRSAFQPRSPRGG